MQTIKIIRLWEGEVVFLIMELDFASSIPIYQQIRNEIVRAVADGRLADGDRLPTIRALAQEVGVNSMTVNKAYQLLKQEGYLITDRRTGATVRCTDEGERQAVGRKVGKELGLLAAEAKVAGLSEGEFLELCRQAYAGRP